MAVHPNLSTGEGTLVNALLQANRWLADMETSHAPGVIHLVAPNDQGLVLVAKNDETFQKLRLDYDQGRLTFSYRLRLSGDVHFKAGAPVVVNDRRAFPDAIQVVDLDSPLGDTDRLRDWLSVPSTVADFVLYRMVVPIEEHSLTVAMGQRLAIPAIDLYTAPT